MISDPGAREEEICPVSDDLLGVLYRSDKQGLAELVATVAPNIRVLLALFCYPRSHLHTMGLAIAATCEEDDSSEVRGKGWCGSLRKIKGSAAAGIRPVTCC